ncbi:MAG: hypothetical protein KKB37_08525 [Alphaproteobacteria bacterium]|nr:hypothetical protein [Alphaproteobacteria bacterium]
MAILRSIGFVFLWPGDRVRRSLGIAEEQDNGILRSMINMVVWGIVALSLALLIIDI